MKASERAQEIVNTILAADGLYTESLLITGVTNDIKAAETEAWNKAVEACAEWAMKNPPVWDEMRAALKRGQP